LIERFYPESRYGGFSDVDGTVVFYSRVRGLLRPDMTVLDVGCGHGSGLRDDPIVFRRHIRNLRGLCQKVIGIDVDREAAQNPGIDEFRPIERVTAWPITNESVDLIVSDFVLEHIDDAVSYFSETARVLKPGGFFCARTSNRIGYVGLLASLVPQRRHAEVLRAARLGRKRSDVFDTHFRVNTVWKLRRALKRAGLRGIAYGYEAEPAYLQFSALAYAFGKYLHVLTPPALRTCLFVFARKPQ
jgi:SAM-dependent methyltransferase